MWGHRSTPLEDAARLEERHELVRAECPDGRFPGTERLLRVHVEGVKPRNDWVRPFPGGHFQALTHKDHRNANKMHEKAIWSALNVFSHVCMHPPAHNSCAP